MSDSPVALLLAAKACVARQDFASALNAVDRGIASLVCAPRHPPPPVVGLHWLRGLLMLRDGHITQSILAFAREIDELPDDGRGGEIRVRAQVGAGFAHLAAHDAVGAIDVFRLALETRPHDGRALIGLHDACRQTALAAEAALLTPRIDRVIAALGADEQQGESALVIAAAKLMKGESEAAYGTLHRFLETAPPGLAGWLIPVDPALSGLRTHPQYRHLMAMLANRDPLISRITPKWV